MEMADSEQCSSDTTSFMTPPPSRQSSVLLSHRRSRASNPPQRSPYSPEEHERNMDVTGNLETINLQDDCPPFEAGRAEPWNTVENITTLGLSFGGDPSNLQQPRFPLEEADDELDKMDNPYTQELRPFEKWVKNIHRKATQRRSNTMEHTDGRALTNDPILHDHISQRHHRKSLSDSSMGFVTAIKSASISLASFSVAPRSRRKTIHSRHHRTDRSSRTSLTGARFSEDSFYLAQGAMIDVDVLDRSIKRRRIIEEIIMTEEDYVGDMKFLLNVYNTLLASVPTLSLALRASINRNLAEIVDLHEDILGDLHRVVPHSEYTQGDYNDQDAETVPGHGHLENRSSKVDNEGSQQTPGMTVEPAVAAGVAKVFGRQMHRFFAYEEYGAQYEVMVKDLASTYRTLPQWEVYQKGLEALAASLASVNSHSGNSKKSMTIGDLLVKPIQRVCRYPLLFAELLKQTPVCDCPDSHTEIHKVLLRLRETTTEINRATEDPRMKVIMTKTWILQDRLKYKDQIDMYSKSLIRALGHIHLCGVLFVTWQVCDGVDGQYMITLLYRDCLVLATSGKQDQVYTIQATIGLGEMRVEEADNGRGLQCHTAPFSWKLVFECDHQLYELILSACSPKEELEWRTRLADRSEKDHADGRDHALLTSLNMPIKSLGSVFGKPGTVARRISIHRATTVGPKSALYQVVIKNTTALKESVHSTSTSINRSQSLLTTNRIPVLAASRTERIRLEGLLSVVWTKEVLPYPGFSAKTRGEHLVRASASSVMRKLSVASITSNFTKRSGSLASLTNFHRATEAELGVPKNTSAKSELSVTKDETPQVVTETSLTIDPATQGSPAATPKRLTPKHGKKNLYRDGYYEVTPPLRTSSANRLKHIHTGRPPISPRLSSCEGNENKSQSRHAKWGRGAALNMSFSTEGLRGFFR